MKLTKSKKGSIVDLIFIAAGCLIVGMLFLIGYKVMNAYNTEIQASTVITANAKTASTTLVGYYPTVIDNSFMFLIVALAIGSLILASLVRISPIFLPIYIIALLFVIFLSGVMSNIYQEMAANANLSTEADNLLFISTILTWLPLIIGTIGTLLAIILYKSWRDSQGV